MQIQGYHSVKMVPRGGDWYRWIGKSDPLVSRFCSMFLILWTGEKKMTSLVIQKKYVRYDICHLKLKRRNRFRFIRQMVFRLKANINVLSYVWNFQASKSCRGLRRFPRFFESIRLEFFVVGYRFESIQIPSSPRGGHEETIWIFGMEYIFDTRVPFFGLEIYT